MPFPESNHVFDLFLDNTKVLDTRNLAVKSVVDKDEGKALPFVSGPEDAALGSALQIDITSLKLTT